MKHWRIYFELPPHVLSVIVAEFFIQWVNASLMYLLPVYMAQLGLRNQEVAWQIVLRFVGVFLLAIPMGKILQKFSPATLFYFSSLMVPLCGLGTVMAASYNTWTWVKIFLFAWGSAFTFMQIPVIPYVLQHSSDSQKTYAISLSYSTWSWGAIFSGIIVFCLSRLHPFFNEKNLLTGICISGLAGFVILCFYPPLSGKIHPAKSDVLSSEERKKDMIILAEALLPTFIIAVGAGFTIPFISLFFYRVHHLSATNFSFFSFVAALLVAWGSMQVPYIKQKLGYKKAVPFTQTLAVIFLIILAFTEYMPEETFALGIALFAFILRQPLMNMAGPMTTEIAMEYVGKKNHLYASAFTSAIWSGSWVISGLLAAWLFYHNLSFFHTFMLTSFLYILGILLYYRLILQHEKKLRKSASSENLYA